MFAIVMDMLCPSDINMLLMMWKFVVPWGSFQSRMHKYFCGEVIYMDKKAERESKNGKEIFKMHLFAFTS